MQIETSNGTLTLLESAYDHNDGYTFDASLNALFQNITYISFIMANTGNGRVDDIALTYDDGSQPPAPVPLPAAGLMLAGALGGLTALRRRKAA